MYRVDDRFLPLRTLRRNVEIVDTFLFLTPLNAPSLFIFQYSKLNIINPNQNWKRNETRERKNSPLKSSRQKSQNKSELISTSGRDSLCRGDCGADIDGSIDAELVTIIAVVDIDGTTLTAVVGDVVVVELLR